LICVAKWRNAAQTALVRVRLASPSKAGLAVSHHRP
jgi:hypothetical protein